MSIYLLIFGLFFYVTNLGYMTFGQLLEKDSIVFNYSVTATTTDNHTKWKKVNIRTHYCPSYCDDLGHLQPSQFCSQSSYCCKVGNALKCCEQSSLAIKDGVTDAFNCHLKVTQRVTTENHPNWKGVNEPSPLKEYCPSHCNAKGEQEKAYNCINPPHCCDFGDYLDCCNNRSLSIGPDITDGYNCAHWKEYWQLVLAVCVPLATLSLIAFLSMTSYLMCRKRRERQGHSRQRTGSGSDISCSSWSVSTVSPNNTMRGNPSRSPGGTSEHTCSRRQRPLEIFVLGPLIPPPYIDKPPPYSAVCNNGEPNAGYDTTDFDALPDYESVGLDPLALLNSNMLAVRGAHLREIQDSAYQHELHENSVNQGSQILNENRLAENPQHVQNVQNVPVPVTLHSINEDDQTAEDTMGNNVAEEGVDQTNQIGQDIVVQFHNPTQSDS